MANEPDNRDDWARDSQRGSQLLGGWAHLQRSLAVSLFHSVKRSRKLVRANLRGRG